MEGHILATTGGVFEHGFYMPGKKILFRSFSLRMKHWHLVQHGWPLQTVYEVKEARHKRHALYDSIYMKYPEQANHRERK